MSASSKKQLRKEQNAAQMTERQLQEKKEAKKLKIYTITFVLVIALVIAFAVSILIRNGVNNSGILEKNTTAVTIGEHKVSSAMLNYFYVDYISETYAYWQESYGDYTDMYLTMLYGLDVTAALDTQYYDTEGIVTWAEFFANQAVVDATAMYALYDQAVANGHTMTEEEIASIDSTIAYYELYASIYGYDVDGYLKSIYGPGATEESFREYMEITTLGQSYYTNYYNSLSYDDAAIREYDAEHSNEYNSFTYSYYYMPATDFLTGGTTDEEGNTTYSEEDKAASVDAAKAAADTLAASAATNGTELNAEIAKIDIYAEDTTAVATTETDALYSTLSEDFAAWLSEDGRVAGDKTVIVNDTESTDEEGNTVTTVNGYYVIIFEGRNDNAFALKNVRHILVSFEGGTADSTTGQVVYSAAEKQTALDKANEILDSYNAGDRTEDSFAALVADNSDDTGSTENGGLYENIYPGQMVEAFEEWCYNEARKTGDVEIIETEYGYHIMYFVGDSTTTYRDFMIESDMINAAAEEWYNGIVDAVTAEDVKIKYLELDYIISAS